MTKEQTIAFVGWLDFKVATGGIIEKQTEVLNLVFSDNGQSNMMTLIGDRFEWKPKIWTDFEQEKIAKLKKLNIVCLLGDLTQYYEYCKSMFPNVEVQYYDYSSYDISITMPGPLARKQYVTDSRRLNTVHCSIGTMRINRYILVKESKVMNYPVFHPEIGINQAKDYEYQISKCMGLPQQDAVAFGKSRMFDDNMHQEKFNQKQIKNLCESYVHFVVTFPNTNWLKDKDDEKFFDTVLCKTLPFMLCEKDSNLSGVELLGFRPYRGFDFSKDSDSDHISRWQGLLKDNRSTFQDIKACEEIYRMNQDVIEFNYKRLLETDWQALKIQQYDLLPNTVKDFLKNF